ncbi:MAG: hypothetical protein IT287_08070, partial [Bdellovibrionaceae bacterium]|nr:hypothetical protein [Pseudobdellovibrionaceae bacterium]
MTKIITVGFLSALWFCWSAAIFIFHLGTLTPPLILDKANALKNATGTFLQKTEQEPIQHLILTGPAYGRGIKAGELTKNLLAQQEKELTSIVESLFKSQKLFLLFEIAIIPYFNGLDKNIPQDYLQEMYGVSQSTASAFNNYAEAYTRQLAYHGLHEVGQRFVDHYKDDR